MATPEAFDCEPARALPHLRLDRLPDDPKGRARSARSSPDKARNLLEAVIAIGTGLDVETALAKIVQAATTLVDARYGALGVIGKDLHPARFITVGMNQAQITAISAYPEGHDPLGEPIRHPVPPRATGIGTHPRILAAPVRVRGRVYGNLYLTEKTDGAAFDADDETVLTALAAAAGVAIDNARLFSESQRHCEQARRRQQCLEISGTLSRELLSADQTGDVMARFVGRLRAFARADLALLAVAQPEQESLLIVAAEGDGAERLLGTLLDVEDTLLGRVHTSGQSAQVSGIRCDARMNSEKEAAPGLGPAFLAPLGTAEQPRGALCVSRRVGADEFDQQTAELTAELAVQAAVVLELAQRRRESEEASLYADRDRIGRDLRDLAIHRLFATSMSLESARDITTEPEAGRRIAQAVTDLDETIKMIRSTIFSLQAHESDPDTPGMRGRVIGICEQAATVLRFTPALRFAGPLDTLAGEPQGEHLLAVLREALSNAARHAHATKLEVDVSLDVKAITLTVTDDGTGIPEDARRSGLADLRERAEQLGGSCTTTTPAAGGTVLAWTVPVLS
jgi:signal transduction histidine kinase